jgi:hypothetical protein
MFQKLDVVFTCKAETTRQTAIYLTLLMQTNGDFGIRLFSLKYRVSTFEGIIRVVSVRP